MKLSKVGQFLMDAYIRKGNISEEFLAYRMSSSVGYLDELIQGEREIDSVDAELLSQVLGRSVQFWLNFAETPVTESIKVGDKLAEVKDKVLSKMLENDSKEDLLALSTIYQRICCTPQ